MKSNQIIKNILIKKFINPKQFGYSVNEMVIAISIIGILATILVPNFRPAVEFAEVLIAEKYLLKAIKECQIGLINNEPNPIYSLPAKDINLGIFKKNKFTFSYTGIGGECSPEYGGNNLRVSRIDSKTGSLIYSLIVNVKTGKKSSEGSLPIWLDWWESKSPSLIPEGDMLLD